MTSAGSQELAASSQQRLGYDSGANYTLQLDCDGGIVPFPAERWYVGFVPALDRRLWHAFVHPRHKHCFALRPIGGNWLVFEPWWGRTPLTVISAEHASRFFMWAAHGDMLLVREEKPGRSSQIRGLMTCAALLTHMLGRPYHVITPHALFLRLKREAETIGIDAGSFVSKLRSVDAAHAKVTGTFADGCAA